MGRDDGIESLRRRLLGGPADTVAGRGAGPRDGRPGQPGGRRGRTLAAALATPPPAAGASAIVHVAVGPCAVSTRAEVSQVGPASRPDQALCLRARARLSSGGRGCALGWSAYASAAMLAVLCQAQQHHPRYQRRPPACGLVPVMGAAVGAGSEAAHPNAFALAAGAPGPFAYQRADARRARTCQPGCSQQRSGGARC